MNDVIDQLRYLREEERHEIGLISNRLGWFLTSESFLLAAATLAHSGDCVWWYGTASTAVLGLFGIVVAIRARFAVQAAQAVLEAWLVHEAQCCSANENSSESPQLWCRLPRPLHDVGHVVDDPLHQMAVKFHLALPLLLMLVWGMVFVLAVVHSAAKMPEQITMTPRCAQLVFVVVAFLVAAVVALLLRLFFSQDRHRVKTGARNLRQRVHKKLNTGTTNP